MIIGDNVIATELLTSQKDNPQLVIRCNNNHYASNRNVVQVMYEPNCKKKKVHSVAGLLQDSADAEADLLMCMNKCTKAH